MRAQGRALCLSFQAAAGAHYLGTMPHANHSPLLPLLGRGGGRERAASPLIGGEWGWEGEEVEKGPGAPRNCLDLTPARGPSGAHASTPPGGQEPIVHTNST